MLRRVLIPFRHAHKLPPYVKALEAAELEAVPGDVAGPVTLARADALLLMGGTDVNPSRYGETPHPETNQPDDDRDALELGLIDQALAKDMPVLAICRGLQILNVYHGGTLIQHLPSARHAPQIDDKSAPVHEIDIKPGSRLSKIARASSWRVNSRHHQAAARIGEGLAITARDTSDGVVEALERHDRSFVLAVQWHPEDQLVSSPEQRELFRSFRDSIA